MIFFSRSDSTRRCLVMAEADRSFIWAPLRRTALALEKPSSFHLQNTAILHQYSFFFFFFLLSFWLCFGLSTIFVILLPVPVLTGRVKTTLDSTFFFLRKKSAKKKKK